MPSQSKSKNGTGRVPITPASCRATTPWPAKTTDRAQSNAALTVKNSFSGSFADPRRITKAMPIRITTAVPAPAITALWPAGPACSQRVS